MTTRTTRIHAESFGYRHDHAPDVDLTVDLRNGPVVLSPGDLRHFVAALFVTAAALPTAPGWVVTIALGDEYGILGGNATRAADALAAFAREHEWDATVDHRDIQADPDNQR